MVSRDEPTSRLYKLRDAASLLSLVAPIGLLVGIIGAFYLASYRLDQLEKNLRDTQDTLSAVKDEQLRRTGRFEDLSERIKSCCNSRYERN